MDIPPEPKEFQKLCGRVGLAMMLSQKVQYALAGYLAMMLSQKVQYALAGYFATHTRVHNAMPLDEAKAQLERHLSKPMGAIVSGIERLAPLPDEVWQKVKSFQAERNWLAHDFDQEATPFLVRNERISEYIARMESIANLASELMQDLNAQGEAHVPAGT